MVLNNNLKYNPIYFYGGKNELPNNHNFTVLANTSEVSFDWEGQINESKAISFGTNSITRQAATPCNVVVAPNGRIIISAYVKMDDGLEPSTVPGNLDFAFTYNAITLYIPNHQHLGNGIYRVWINTAISAGATITSISVYKNISAATAKSFKIYGLQLERANILSDTPTDYAPTYGTALGLGKHKPYTIIRGNTIYGKKRLLYDTGMIFAKAREKNFTAPDLREKLLINEFIKQEIRSGVWHKQDLYGLFAYNEPALMNFARINWRTPFGRGTIENICTQSENFADASFVYLNNTKTPNSTDVLAPDGTYTACKFENIGFAGNAQKADVISNSTTLTFSIYFKKGTALTNSFRLYDNNAGVVRAAAVFTYATESLSITTGSASVVSVGDGWYRIAITSNTCVSGNTHIIQYGAYSATASSGDSWYVWHPQVENNSYASDFIPTGATPAKGDNLFMLYGGLIYGAYGFKGNGLDGYIDTQFNPATMGRNYTLNNAGRGAVVFDEGVGSIGSHFIDGNNLNIYANKLFAYNTDTHRINQGNGNLAITVDLAGSGYKDIMRTSNVNVTVRNKAVETATTANSTSVESYNQHLFRAGGQYSNVGVSDYWISAALTYAQSQTHRANLNNLLAGFGLNQIA